MRCEMRCDDEKKTHLIDLYMDRVYEKNGIDAKRVSDPFLQKKGVDLFIGGHAFDEKAAITAWNRDIKTFNLEVSCDTNVKSHGWFYSKTMETDGYIFIFPRAEDGTMLHITSCEALFITKDKLRSYMCRLGYNDPVKIKQDLKKNGKFKRNRLRWKVNDEVEFIKNYNLKGRPVNILISRTWLRQHAFWKISTNEKVSF